MYFWFSINVPPTTPLTPGWASYSMDSSFFIKKVMVSLKINTITVSKVWSNKEIVDCS